MRIIISGILGRMGKSVLELAESEKISVVAGLDTCDTKIENIPVYSILDKLPTNADCAIDFSSPAGTIAIAHWCEKNKIPLVSGTTGLDNNEMEILKKLSEHIPILWSSNMSIGVAVLRGVAKDFSKIFDNADIEIEELHHRDKVDSPSGTALTIAESILDSRGLSKNCLIFGRKGKVGQRPKCQIAIHSIRGGNIVGEHRILFLMDEEEIVLTHKVCSRKLFARGAIKIAKWLAKSKPGMYRIEDYIKEQI